MSRKQFGQNGTRGKEREPALWNICMLGIVLNVMEEIISLKPLDIEVTPLCTRSQAGG